MADDDDKPDNVIQFRRTGLEPVESVEADLILEECMGDYHEVIVVGLNADGEMVVTGNISDISQVYETLASAAQNIAMAHLEMIFQGTHH